MTRLCFIVAIFISTGTAYGQSAEDSTKENKDRVILNMFGATNEERFTLFKDNINKKVKDKFQVWQYTMEGDPIITYVKFNGRKVIVRINGRRDKFASTKDKWLIDRYKISSKSVMGLNNVEEIFKKF